MVAKADINAVTKNQGGFQSPVSCNSTITALGSGATFKGKIETNAFPHIMFSVETDQAGTLFLDFSDDGGDNFVTEPESGFAIKADEHKQRVIIKGPRTVRIRYVNGTDGAQTFLRLFIYYGFFTDSDASSVVSSVDTATLFDPVAVGSATSVKILDENQDRLYITVAPKTRDIWLKFQAASVDNDKKGIPILRDEIYEFPADFKYTGEISAITDTDTANVYVTEA